MKIALFAPKTDSRSFKPAPQSSTTSQTEPVDRYSAGSERPTSNLRSKLNAIARGSTQLVAATSVGSAGWALGGMASTLALAGFGLASAPVAVPLVMLGAASTAIAGATLALFCGGKASDAAAALGGKVFHGMGLSEETGQTLGRGALALAAGAPTLLSVASVAALVSGAVCLTDKVCTAGEKLWGDLRPGAAGTPGSDRQLHG